MYEFAMSFGDSVTFKLHLNIVQKVVDHLIQLIYTQLVTE